MWLNEKGVSAHVEAKMRRVPGEWVGMWPDGVCKMFVNMCVCKKERESLGGGVLYQQGVRGHEKERGGSLLLCGCWNAFLFFPLIFPPACTCSPPLAFLTLQSQVHQ